MRLGLSLVFIAVALLLGVAAFATTMPIVSTPTMQTRVLVYGVVMYGAGVITIALVAVGIGLTHPDEPKPKTSTPAPKETGVYAGHG